MGSFVLDEDRLELIIQGHAAFQSLWAGCELKLFELLSNKPDLTRSELAKELKIKEYPLRILLMALTSMGVLESNNEKYRNSDIAEKRLIPGHKGSLVPIMGWQHHIVYKGLHSFTDSIKESKNLGLEHFSGEGSTLYERLVADKPLEKIFQNAMSALSSLANKEMIKSGEYDHVKHIVDVGGGDATNAIELVKEYPNLRVTVFDSGSVCDIARENIRKNNLQERIQVQAGNAFLDPFPEGIDAILFCHIFPIFSPERNNTLLEKCYGSLPGGGSVFVFNMMCNDSEDGPLTTVLGSLYFLSIATGQGMLYPWKDYEQWFAASGFSKVKRIEGLPFYHGLFIGKK